MVQTQPEDIDTVYFPCNGGWRASKNATKVEPWREIILVVITPLNLVEHRVVETESE
jgi:hypothetical protein